MIDVVVVDDDVDVVVLCDVCCVMCVAQCVLCVVCCVSCVV